MADCQGCFGLLTLSENHTGATRFLQVVCVKKSADKMTENNNYGALNNESENGPKRHRFEFSEPNVAKKSCCAPKGDTDGFKIIVISMFVFAVGVTVALIITIASGKFIFDFK